METQEDYPAAEKWCYKETNALESTVEPTRVTISGPQSNCAYEITRQKRGALIFKTQVKHHKETSVHLLHLTVVSNRFRLKSTFLIILFLCVSIVGSLLVF